MGQQYQQLEGGSSSSVDVGDGQQVLPAAPQVNLAELSTPLYTRKPLSKRSLWLRVVGTLVVVSLIGLMLPVLALWVLFEWPSEEERQAEPFFAPSDMVNVADLPAEMLANVPDTIERNFVFCLTRESSALDIEERVPHCVVDSKGTHDRGLKSVYYLNTAEQVERAFSENDDDFGLFTTRVYPKKAERSTIAVHAPGPGHDWDYGSEHHLVKYIAPDQAIVYQFYGVWVDYLADFLEKYDLADQSIRDRMIAEAVNLENMPEQMVISMPEGIKQKLAYCETDGGAPSDLDVEGSFPYCGVLKRDFDSEGFKFVSYVDDAEQVERAFSNPEDDYWDYETWVYPKGAGKHTIALHALAEERNPNEFWEYYVVKYIAPDQALVYKYQLISKKKFVKMLEKHEVVDQAIIDQIAADLR